MQLNRSFKLTFFYRHVDNVKDNYYACKKLIPIHLEICFQIVANKQVYNNSCT